MISIDLSKMTPPRFLVYLLSLIPGLFFLFSVTLGNPGLTKTNIEQIEWVYPLPPYALLLVLVGSGFVIGQAFVQLSWLIEQVLAGLYCLSSATFRKLFGGHRFYRWFAEYQEMPQKTNFRVRALRKLMILATSPGLDTPDAQAVRWCLAAATETLLKQRYEIEPERASGPGGAWQVWYSTMGKPVKPVVEYLMLVELT